MLLSSSYLAPFLLLSLCAATDSGSYRLPLQVIPNSYELSLVPYLDTLTFDGEVAINVTARLAVPNITLHVNGMIIKRIEVTNADVISTTEDEEREFLTINLSDVLEIGAQYTITITYEGKVREIAQGFYQTPYVTASGETRKIAVTQFQATHARKAFPCFDEPALKATFDIRIAPPTGTHALSNMPLISVADYNSGDGSRVWYIFDRSVRMSTYLVAFAVSDYCNISDGGIQRIFGSCDIIETGKYALNVSQQVLDLMAEWTGHPFQVPKCDQISVPEQGGAMENWGLVTYDQAYLLLPEETYEEKYWSLMVIAHELAHQWFGNQVTLSWWSHTWLNEGFASFFQYFAADKIETTWQMMDDFVTDIQTSVMFIDSFEAFSLPMTRDVEDPVAVWDNFNTFQYDKGSCIINQMFHILGETTFFEGLNVYLTERAYDVADPDDLSDAWQKVVAEGLLPRGITIKSIMDSWTTQAGYPLLTVQRDYEAGTAVITQQRFLKDAPLDKSRKWFIPISYTTGRQKDFDTTKAQLWLTPADDNITITGLAADDWLLLNIQWTYYYRVNYDAENWNRLLAAVVENDIPSLNVVQISDDLFELDDSGLLPPGVEIPWDDCRLFKLPSFVVSKMMFRRALPKEGSANLVAACGSAGHRACLFALNYVGRNLRKLESSLGGPEEVFWLLKQMSSHISTTSEISALRDAVAAAQMAWPQLLSSAVKSRLMNDAKAAFNRNKLNSPLQHFGKRQR